MRVAIIGAGISGLSLAYFLERNCPHLDISIFESSNRPGGWIKTRIVGGDLFECGPRSFRIEKRSKPLIDLISALGLENEMLISAPDAKKRYLAWNGALQETPNGIGALVSTSFGRTLLRGVLCDLFAHKSSEKDESVHSFFSRRFGEVVAGTFIDPLIAGIYASDPKMLSLASAFPNLSLLEKRYRSVILGSLFDAFLSRTVNKKDFSHPLLGKIATFREGMEVLPQALYKAIRSPMYMHTPITSARIGKREVALDMGSSEKKFDHVFSTGHHQWLAHQVAIPQVSHNSCVAVSLGFSDEILKKRGFGFLAPSSQENELLGVVFDSIVFPSQARRCKTKLSVMMGGARSPESIELAEDVLIEKARFFAKKYLAIDAVPQVAFVTYARQAIATYPVGHVESLDMLEKEFRDLPITLLGASLYGVSLPQCVERAHQVAQRWSNEKKQLLQ